MSTRSPSWSRQATASRPEPRRAARALSPIRTIRRASGRNDRKPRTARRRGTAAAPPSASRYGGSCCAQRRPPWRRSSSCSRLHRPQPGSVPDQAHLYQLHGGRGRAGHCQHRRHPADDRRPFRSLGRRRPGPHLLCRRGADARLRHAAASWPPRPRSLAGADPRRDQRAIVVRFRIHSFVVTLGTMLIWRGVLIALTGGFPMTVAIPHASRRRWRGRCWAASGCRCSGSSPSALLGTVPADAHPVRQLGPGARPERAGGAQSRRAGRPGHHHPVHDRPPRWPPSPA